MSETAQLRGRLIALWVFISGLAGYGCLAYAVYQAHSDHILSLVNRFNGADV